MFKSSIVLCSMLLVTTASVDVFDYDNNFIEFGPPPAVQLPYYPYQAVEPSHHVYSYNKPHHAADIIVPAHETEIVEVVEPAGLISTAISCTISAVKSVIVFLLANVPGLATGSAVALGLCKLTGLCDSQVTIYEAQTELRSLATPERLSRAANFVKEAMKKYNEMQKK